MTWRHGKANIDQAERLREKRHALRQGRLYVHLNDRRLNIDELDRAFKWNDHKDNAFSTMKGEDDGLLSQILAAGIKKVQGS